MSTSRTTGARVVRDRKAAAVAESIRLGRHPVMIMRSHSITAGQLQAYLLVASGCRRSPRTLAEGTWGVWLPVFWAKCTLGLCV